ncbi:MULTISPECIES: hypothetical protein [Clostridium]|uniref:hypothetical protein n=1 Tax=Clostridium sp. 3-3 TaxID=2070757 RepID=UPI000CDAE648|nr:hypothetical protein [Clostridium sp. 3-3]POO86827.1 hypothetical protein C1H59_08670 [Clostridium sp. 3-3]
MEGTDLWLSFKVFFVDLVKYGFPTIALGLSVLSFRDSRKAGKMQSRLNKIEERLKKYELEEKEKQREEATKAKIEARVIRVSKGNYRMKIWNSGKAIAYNVDFKIQEEYEGFVGKSKVPYEFLDPGKGFDELVVVCQGTPDKFRVVTTWKDKQGVDYSKEQIVSIEY